MAGAKVFNARLTRFMPIDAERHAAVPTNPVERGPGRPVGAHGRPDVAERARNLFRKAVQDMTESWLWELGNQIQHRVPDPVDYVEMRRKTFGSDLTMSLSRLSQGDGGPAEVFRTRPDARAGELGRRLRVLHQRRLLLPEGDRVRGRAPQRRAGGAALPRPGHARGGRGGEQPDDRADAAVPAHRRHGAPGRSSTTSSWTPHAQEKLKAYVEQLQQWMAGILRWHVAVDRYKEFELRKSPPRAAAPRPHGAGHLSRAHRDAARGRRGDVSEKNLSVLPEGKR